MKLLLQKNIENVGNIGDIVDVAKGYGRNYLLPRGFAVEVTKDNLNRFESIKRRLIALEQETKEKYQVLAKEIEKASCTIIARSSEEGHLYGSVTVRDISSQFATEGLDVDPKAILLDAPIKELGIYKVRVRLHPGVECEAKVWVVKGDDALGGRKKPPAEDADGEEPEDSFTDEADEVDAEEGD
jgi:large subunit ribosomal protein L9